MKNVLLITSHILPSEHVGAVRPTKFAKYLPEFGWRPVILTPKRNRESDKIEADIPIYYARFPNPDRIFALGRRLFPKLASLPPTNSKKTPKIEFFSRKQVFVDWLFIPDEEVTGVPFAVKKGLEIAKTYCIDAIFATGMYFSCHLIGLILSRSLKCPLIVDFRDPWLTSPFFYYPTKIHRRIHAILEGKVVESSARVITVSKPIYQDFLERYPDQNPDKFQVIHNGYDSEDFVDLEPLPVSKNTIEIVHSGSLYPGREPMSFLQAVTLLDSSILKRIKITFLGRNALGLRSVVEQLGLQDIIALKDYMPYYQSLEYISGATILVVLPGLGHGSLTTKLFEYLKMGKFILALSPPCNKALPEVLENANVGLVVDSDSPDRIAKGLTHLVRMVDSGAEVEPNWTYIEQFDRKNLTGQLAQVLNEIIS
jgi:glycosyltransferase involved in cell wall biosynthesis